MPLLLADFVYARGCKLKCEKFLTRPFDMFPQQLLSINNILWSNILWNKDKNTMVMNHQKLVEQLLIYFWDRDLLSQKEIQAMKSDIKSIRLLMEMDGVDDLLESAINP